MAIDPEHVYSSAPPPKPPPLPENCILLKRPLLHPPIITIRSTRSPQTIYISSKTPFISAVKRVKKILDAQEAPLWSSSTIIGTTNSATNNNNSTASLDDISTELHRHKQSYRHNQRRRGRGGGGGGASGSGGRGGRGTRVGEPLAQGVVLKATGKAINKCLSLGVYFMKDEKFTVRVGTGTIDTADDIVKRHCPVTTSKPVKAKAKKRGNKSGDDGSEKANIGGQGATTTNLLTTTTTTSNKKRKSAEIDDDGDSENGGGKGRERAIIGKRPKTGEHTSTSTAVEPSQSSPMDQDPSPSNIATQQTQLSGSTTQTKSDTHMTDVHSEDEDENGHENEDEDDEDDEDDEEEDDDDDEEYMRTRKLSVIEIRINLVGI